MRWPSSIRALPKSPTDSLLTVIVADTAYTSLNPYSEDQVVIAWDRMDRQGRRPAKDDQVAYRGKGRPRKYEPGIIRFIEDLPPGAEGGSDEGDEYTDTIKKQLVDIEQLRRRNWKS